MKITLIIISFLCLITGILGSILPALPGLSLCYIALILLQLGIKSALFTKTFFIVFGIITILAMLLDYIVPLIGAKLYGASPSGTWGAVIGMLVGIFVFPPAGMILGIFIGAIMGELIAGKEYAHAFGTGFMSSLGSIAAIIIKLSLCAVMAFYYFKGLFS